MAILLEEADQRAALVRQRRIASGLLVVMALIFATVRLVPEPGFGLQLVRAASEAALVGGLADWFAVTALFRHPFGIPIPHTAIIPRHKDRIGAALGRFVERHFLEPELLTFKLRDLDLAGRGARWLSHPEHADATASRLNAAAPWLVRALGDPELRDFLRRTLHRQLSDVNLAPILGRLLEVLTTARQHQLLFDRALLLATDLLIRHEETIYARVSEHSRWWVPSTIDRTIARRIITGIYELLNELASHDHAVRLGFDQAVDEFITRLKHSPEMHERIEEIKRELLSSPVVQGYLAGVWDQLQQLVLADVESDDSQLRSGLAAALASLGANLQRDAAVRERLNRRIEGVVLEFGVTWRAEIGAFIAEVVRRWDADTLTQRIELAVGRDLQYIRINGTVVGALVGILLFLMDSALPV